MKALRKVMNARVNIRLWLVIRAAWSSAINERPWGRRRTDGALWPWKSRNTACSRSRDDTLAARASLIRSTTSDSERLSYVRESCRWERARRAAAMPLIAECLLKCSGSSSVSELQILGEIKTWRKADSLETSPALSTEIWHFEMWSFGPPAVNGGPFRGLIRKSCERPHLSCYIWSSALRISPVMRSEPSLSSFIFWRWIMQRRSVLHKSCSRKNKYLTSFPTGFEIL